MTALHAALRASLDSVSAPAGHAVFAGTQIAITDPASRAHRSGHATTESRLAQALAERAGRPTDPGLKVLAAAAVTALLTVAFTSADGDTDGTARFDDAFASLAASH